MALNVMFEEGTAFFPVILFSPTPCQIKGMFEFAHFFFSHSLPTTKNYVRQILYLT